MPFLTLKLNLTLAPITVRWLVSPLLILSDFHCVGVSGPSQSVRGLWDVIYFLKAMMTDSFQISISKAKQIKSGTHQALALE